MKIGIDMDSVITDTLAAVQNLNPAWSGVNWNGGCNPAEYEATWEKVKKVDNFWADLKPLSSFDSESIALLRKLLMLHDVFFITDRFATLGMSPLKQTKYWLYVNALIQSPNVIIAKDKGAAANMLQLNVFFDDRPKNCVDVLAAMPEAAVFLCDCTHNQDFSDPRIPRLKNLTEFLKLILEMKR